jgi:hypothetical protein
METGAHAGAGRYVGAGRPLADPFPATEALRLRYAGYRTRQGRDLLALMPREGVRSLLRLLRAREPEVEPTLDRVAVLAAEILPLPPFRIWLEDFHRHRAEHLAQAGPPVAAGPAAPEGEAVTIDVRSFSTGPEEWVAALLVHAVDEGWRGAIHFHRPPEARSVRTADIFREADVTAVRDRFRGFDGVTLAAFLRSALP